MNILINKFSLVAIFIMLCCSFKTMAQSPMEGNLVNKKALLYNNGSEKIVIAYSYDRIHWTKTSIVGGSKKEIKVDGDQTCYVRVYTQDDYILFEVERKKKYVFIKNDEDQWELEEV